jgi:hypothetical protein
LLRHPRDANVVDGRKGARCGSIQNCWRDRKLRILIVRKRRFYKLKRGACGKISLPSREKIMAAAVPCSAARILAKKAV